MAAPPPPFILSVSLLVKQLIILTDNFTLSGGFFFLIVCFSDFTREDKTLEDEASQVRKLNKNRNIQLTILRYILTKKNKSYHIPPNFKRFSVRDKTRRLEDSKTMQVQNQKSKHTRPGDRNCSFSSIKKSTPKRIGRSHCQQQIHLSITKTTVLPIAIVLVANSTAARTFLPLIQNTGLSDLSKTEDRMQPVSGLGLRATNSSSTHRSAQPKTRRQQLQTTIQSSSSKVREGSTRSQSYKSAVRCTACRVAYTITSLNGHTTDHTARRGKYAQPEKSWASDSPTT